MSKNGVGNTIAFFYYEYELKIGYFDLYISTMNLIVSTQHMQSSTIWFCWHMTPYNSLIAHGNVPSRMISLCVRVRAEMLEINIWINKLAHKRAFRIRCI